MAAARTRDGFWAATGLAFVGLFLGGLVFADVLAGRPYPGIDEPIGEITEYFTRSGPEVRGLSFLHSLAAMALLAFAAYLRGFFARSEGKPGALSALAFGGAVMAAVFLLLSALLFWALARPATAGEPGIARVLFDLSYLAGGLALLLSLSAFIGSNSLLALQARVLPPWVAWTGVLAAIVALLSTGTMLAETGAFGPGGIVVVGALPPFLWIFATSVVLIRANRAQRRASPSSGLRGGVTADA